MWTKLKSVKGAKLKALSLFYQQAESGPRFSQEFKKAELQLIWWEQQTGPRQLALPSLLGPPKE